jgi:hypothetical protein
MTINRDTNRDTNTDREQRPGTPLRDFGVRAAALAGLVVAVGVPVAGAAGAFDAPTGVVIAGEHPDPSTCCGRDPDPT